MNTIKENVENEIVITKSRFICLLYKINNINDVNDILTNLKREYKDATHHCYAYIFGNEKRFSDDNEPNHTAGIPILNVLENKELDNVLAVVIRYFGGIKLGTGGLVRAYTNAVTEALNKTEIVALKKECKMKIEFSYEDIESINYYLNDYDITYKSYDVNVIYEFTYFEGEYPDDIDSLIIKKEQIF